MPVIDLGKVVGDPGASMRFRGEWLSGSEYFNNESYIDTVTHHGSLWVCKQTNTGQEPIEGDYWGIGAYGTETGFDATITIPATGWSGVSAPFAQTVIVSGMTYNKAIVYAVQSNNATPTDSEKAEYAKITGISQNTDSITFYADEKPTADIIIRAFNGAGSEDAADLSVIAAPFDTGEDYTEGRYCMYEGQMWRFDKAKPSGAWDSSKATSTTVAKELEAHEAAINSLNSRTDELESVLSMQLSESIWLYHNKNVVSIEFYVGDAEFSIGWNTIATIPSGLRPGRTINFLSGDDSAISSENNAALFGRITVDGNINIYVFSDKLAVKPVGHVMYIMS